MYRTTLNLILGKYVTYLRKNLAPKYQPSLHKFEVEATALIKSLPSTQPEELKGLTDNLTEENIKKILNWVTDSLLIAFRDDDWATVAAAFSSLVIKLAIPELVKEITVPTIVT